MSYPPAMPPADTQRERGLGTTDTTLTRRQRLGLLALGFATLVIALVGIVAMASSTEPTDASVAQILETPATYDGDRVASEGEITEFLTDRTLVIEDDGTRGGGLLLLVQPTALVRGYAGMQPPVTPVAELLGRTDVIEFHGTVDTFDRSGLSDDLGLVLHAELFDGWEGRPSVIVDRIEVSAMSDGTS